MQVDTGLDDSNRFWNNARSRTSRRQIDPKKDEMTQSLTGIDQIEEKFLKDTHFVPDKRLRSLTDELN